MSLADAVQPLSRLKALLEQEVLAARETREHVRRMDPAAVLERAEERTVFADRVRAEEAAVVEALTRAAAAHSLEPLRLDLLAPLDPDGVAAVRALLDETRALASALAELEELNGALLARAQQVLRAYIGALAGGQASASYDRRGYRVAMGAPAGVSQRT